MSPKEKVRLVIDQKLLQSGWVWDDGRIKAYDKSKWNGIVNKTPISASSNREIGGVAPSVYLGKLEKKGSVLPSDLNGYVETHWIDHAMLRKNFVVLFRYMMYTQRVSVKGVSIEARGGM